MSKAVPRRDRIRPPFLAALYLAAMAAMLAACEDDTAQESLLCFLEDQPDGTKLLTCDNGFDHVMSNGRDGADGAAAFLDISTEPAGDNCPAGGVRITQTVDGQAAGDAEYLCNDTLGADVAALEARIADLEQENADLADTLETFVTAEDLGDYALDSDLDPLTTVAEVEAMIDALDTETKADLDDLDARVDTLEPLTDEAVRLISEDMTLNVPTAEFPTIQAAQDWLEGYVIGRDVNVDIKLANGTYTFTEPLFFAHATGNRIRLIGNPGNAGQVILQFNGTSGIRTGRLGLVEGVTIRGNMTAGTNGIESTRGGFARLAADVVVEDFGRSCIRAVFGAVVEADGVTVRNCGEDGFAAVFTSVISAPGGYSEGNVRHGFVASVSSSLYVEGAESHDNGDSGFTGFAGSGVWAEGATATGNDRFGFVASVSSGITAINGLADGNTLTGFNAFAGSGIRADGATASNNGQFGFGSHLSSGIRVLNGLSHDNGWHGMSSSNASGLEANGSTSRNNDGIGFDAWTSSGIVADDSFALDNLNSGYNANGSSALVARRSDALRNGVLDESEWGGGATSHADSSLNVQDALIEDNFEGVTSGGGLADAQGATIQDNVTFGVNAYWNGYVDITGATIDADQIPPWYTPAHDNGTANVIFDRNAAPPSF